MGKESEKEEVYVYVKLNHFSGVLVHLKLTQHCKSIIVVIQLLSCIQLFGTHELEQTLGDSKGQGSLACCSSWVHKELDAT